MTRKYGQSMTNILAIHSEWLVANGYLTKHKRHATTYKRNCQNKKHRRRRKLQDASDLQQVSKSLGKEQGAGFCK